MLKEQIEKDLAAAMRNKERRLSILRMLRAALQNVAIEKRTKVKDLKAELDDKETLDVVRRQVKQLKESLQDFQNGNRADLVEKAKEELETLEKYVPAAMPEAELEKIVEETIKELGAAAPSDAGKVMGAVMKKVAGRAEGTAVKEMVNKKLAQ